MFASYTSPSVKMVQKDKTLETSQVEGEPSPSPGPAEACAEAPRPVEEPRRIGVELTGRRKFISGVVEGEHCLALYLYVFCEWLLSLADFLLGYFACNLPVNCDDPTICQLGVRN